QRVLVADDGGAQLVARVTGKFGERFRHYVRPPARSTDAAIVCILRTSERASAGTIAPCREPSSAAARTAANSVASTRRRAAAPAASRSLPAAVVIPVASAISRLSRARAVATASAAVS